MALLLQLNTPEQVRQYVLESGWVKSGTDIKVESLSGGVSSNVWKVETPEGRWVLKQALEKLKVQADWFADVERIHREHEVMEALAPVVSPGSIPKVLHTDYINHTYLMECAMEGATTWKDLLMEKHFSKLVASEAGKLLREIHEGSQRLPKETIEKLRDQKYFVQLRVDPFHFFLMKRYPVLAPSIQKLVDAITLETSCLVHGDFSPKNMLVEKDDHLVLIDFEVAHWGNPVYDLSYCIGHLLLKAWHLKRPEDILNLVNTLLKSYGDEPSSLMPHLGLMLLARLDGKSTVNYIKDDVLKDQIRRVAIGWIGLPFKGNHPMHDMAKAFGMNR